MMDMQALSRLGYALWAVVSGLGWAGAAFAGSDCWVDIYDQADFQGAHVRIEGPKELPTLKALDGEDWSNRIESLVVGTTATVVAFKREDFNKEHHGQVYHPDAFRVWGQEEMPAYHDLEITFGSGKREHHLGELRFNRTINSLKIQCAR
jgi:hypothetical protein